MRELVLEVLIVQEHGNALLNQRHFQELVDVWSLGWIFLKHGSDKLVHLSRIVLRKPVELTLDDFLSKLMKTSCIERRA